jgi:hypothetical protein
MKTYVLCIELDEGNDEWWDEVRSMKARPARAEVVAEIRRCLADRGFIKPGCRVSPVLTRRRRS